MADATVQVLHADRSPADHALRADTHRLLGELPDARAQFDERDATDELGARTGLMDLADLDLPESAERGRLPVRIGALHARRALAAAGGRCPRPAHPVRGLRA